MTDYNDIALEWNSHEADIVIENNDIKMESGLETAVIISLFTDRLVDIDDLPEGESDPRGFWGDMYPDKENDLIGSRLWLLSRAKNQNNSLIKAKEYALEALQWMIDEGVADRIEVNTEFNSSSFIALEIDIYRPTEKPKTFKYNLAWENQALKNN